MVPDLSSHELNKAVGPFDSPIHVIIKELNSVETGGSYIQSKEIIRLVGALLSDQIF